MVANGDGQGNGMTDDTIATPDHFSAPLQELAPHIGNTPIAPANGIAAIALAMALKFHDINTVQDGTLYQQYKLEGRNMSDLHLSDVFETAIKIEAHLIGSSQRIARIVIDAVADGFKEEDARQPEPEGEPAS